MRVVGHDLVGSLQHFEERGAVHIFIREMLEALPQHLCGQTNCLARFSDDGRTQVVNLRRIRAALLPVPRAAE